MEPGLKDIEPIYHAAIEKDAGRERSAYLDAACGQNTALRALDGLLCAPGVCGRWKKVKSLKF